MLTLLADHDNLDGDAYMLAAEVLALIPERDALREQLEAQTSRADMWKARCNHGTDASELKPGEEAYERLRAERDALKVEVEASKECCMRRIDAEADNKRLRAEIEGLSCGCRMMAGRQDELHAEVSRLQDLVAAWKARQASETDVS
jgi:outer membrane murein-binding lipoprotein Lpp